MCIENCDGVGKEALYWYTSSWSRHRRHGRGARAEEENQRAGRKGEESEKGREKNVSLPITSVEERVLREKERDADETKTKRRIFC